MAMKRFAKVMALFAVFLLMLYAFDRLQTTTTTATKAAHLEPEQSFTFAIEPKTAGNGKQAEQERLTAQGQPLQGFAVKKQRKASTQKGNIIITGNAIKETTLEGKQSLQEEGPINVEVYELEQEGGSGKNNIAVMITGLIVLAMLLTITYNRITRFRKGGTGREGEPVNKEASTGTGEAKEAKSEEEKTAPRIIGDADHETLKFHESLKKFEEKEILRQQNLFSEKAQVEQTASAAADAYRPKVDSSTGPSRKSDNSPIAQSQILHGRTAHSAMGGIAADADLRQQSTWGLSKNETEQEQEKHETDDK